jgi:molybdopterin-guanine dinucleotide biosynthesis protein A
VVVRITSEGRRLDEEAELTVPRTEIIGVLLAGGLSRRMGGGDKGLLDLAGKTMLARVIDRLRPQVSDLVINANGDPGRFAAFALPVVPDTLSDNPGPLAGVLAGMRWAAANRPSARYVLTASTDAPFLPLDLVSRLAAAAHARPGAIAMARSAGKLQPVIGLWPIAHADDLEQAVRDEGIRKVLAWTDRHGVAAVDFDPVPIGDARIDPFFNANTPEEMDEARRLIAAGGAQ